MVDEPSSTKGVRGGFEENAICHNIVIFGLAEETKDVLPLQAICRTRSVTNRVGMRVKGFIS